jgi:hypothetical protein
MRKSGRNNGKIVFLNEIGNGGEDEPLKSPKGKKRKGILNLEGLSLFIPVLDLKPSKGDIQKRENFPEKLIYNF